MEDNDDFDVLGIYVEDEEDSAAAAAAKEEAKQKRREHFQQNWPPPPPPLSPEEMARNLIDDVMHQKLWEYDPRTGSSFYTRYWSVADFTKFDIDEETQYGPMRFTDSLINEGRQLSESVNVLCLKIQSSDVGFPINVYGTVIMRDNLDYRCNYIYRRDRDNCQLIKSQGDSLILTGPCRGAVFLGNVYLEIDLNMREDGEERNDRKFNKVIEHVDGARIQHRVERRIVDSWLSDVELVFAHVKKALEATIEIKILSGPESFVGKITACITDLPDDHEMLLYDYDSANIGRTVVAGADTDRIIQLFRHVVAVSADQMLVFRIWDDSSCVSPPSTTSFIPRINGSDSLVTCGLYRLQIKVVWSRLM